MGAVCHAGHHSFTACTKVTLALPSCLLTSWLIKASVLCVVFFGDKRAEVVCLVVATKRGPHHLKEGFSLVHVSREYGPSWWGEQSATSVKWLVVLCPPSGSRER